MTICFCTVYRAARYAATASLVLTLSLTSVAQSSTSGNPDARIVTGPERPPVRPAETAWTMLTTALKDTRHADLRIQAIAALGTLGSDKRAETLIVGAMHDPELDVRTAAILAAGQTANRNLLFDLRASLDDKEPQVAYAAATTLWKMQDRSGEDILLAIIEGERSAVPTMMHGTRHNISRDLHNPGSLARIGAMQGASMLLGPFGFGLAAIEYMRKNGGDLARVEAIELVAQQKTAPIRDELIAALADKDPAVRAAAAKAVGHYHESIATQALVPVFNDPKAPVRLTAAAAYLRSEQPAEQERHGHTAGPRASRPAPAKP